MNVVAASTALYWSVFFQWNRTDGSIWTFSWRHIRRHTITAVMMGLLIFTGPFTLLNSCPNHWSEVNDDTAPSTALLALD